MSGLKQANVSTLKRVGLGCIANLFSCGLGAILGIAAVTRVKGLREGPDEVGSMGIILPDGEDFAGFFLGGLAGLAIYHTVRLLFAKSQLPN